MTDKPMDKHLTLDMPPKMQASLVERATREGITPTQVLRNALSIGMVYEEARATATHYEWPYSALSLSPRDQRQLARMPWL